MRFLNTQNVLGVTAAPPALSPVKSRFDSDRNVEASAKEVRLGDSYMRVRFSLGSIVRVSSFKVKLPAFNWRNTGQYRGDLQLHLGVIASYLPKEQAVRG